MWNSIHCGGTLPSPRHSQAYAYVDEEGDDGSESTTRQDRSAHRREVDREPDIGKIVCVEVSGDKKKGKEPWFPGLIVAPTAQDTVPIRVKDEYLVRSFKDGR